MVSVREPETRGGDRHGDTGAEALRLKGGTLYKFAAGDARREADVVLDPRGRAGLATDGRRVHEDRSEALGGRVNRGTEACRSGAEYQHVRQVGRCTRRSEVERLGDLAVRRIAQR